MNFANDEELERAIMNAGQGKGMDIDDEFAALEAEILGEGKPKKNKDDLELEALEKEDSKPKRKTSDDELAALENEKDNDAELDALEKEGFDDLEEEKPKQKKISETKPQPKPQPQPQSQKQVPVMPKPQPQITKKEVEKPKQKGGIDLYPEKAEKRYHDVEKMVSLGVLEKETQICDMIIDYKKKRDEDYDTWEDKKDAIKDKTDIITSYINDEIWDFEMYKKKIKEQYQWESKLLIYVEKDPNLKEEQKNKLKERVNERKQIIEKELTTNIEEQQQEEEKEEKEQPKEEETKTSKQPSSTTTSAQGNKSSDFYPEKVENKYHVVAKMDSLGVLERELKICDIIIGYKKKKGEEYDTWELKKDTIETKKQVISSSLDSGGMDLERYKKKIKEEYNWEKKLLIFVEKDTTLNEAQKKVIIERVNNRKKIIEEELVKGPNSEAKEEVKENPKQKNEEKMKKEELMTKKSLNPLFNVPKEKEADEVKRLTQVVTDRLKEYREAYNYFQAHELSEQQTSAIKSLKDKSTCSQFPSA